MWALFENIPSWTDNYLTIKILPVSCDFLSRRESFSRFSLFLLLKRHPWRSRTRNKLASLHTQAGMETIIPSCECFCHPMPSFPYFYIILSTVREGIFPITKNQNIRSLFSNTEIFKHSSQYIIWCYFASYFSQAIKRIFQILNNSIKSVLVIFRSFYCMCHTLQSFFN